MFTKAVVENAKEFGGQVIYGDTDSVFVAWPGLEARSRAEKWSNERLREEVMAASNAACARVTKLLRAETLEWDDKGNSTNPMNLQVLPCAFRPPPNTFFAQNEKLFQRLLMIQKKQYAGPCRRAPVRSCRSRLICAPRWTGFIVWPEEKVMSKGTRLLAIAMRAC
jgi:DNA polymerase elongation subunit (family B)